MIHAESGPMTPLCGHNQWQQGPQTTRAVKGWTLSLGEGESWRAGGGTKGRKLYILVLNTDRKKTH